MSYKTAIQRHERECCEYQAGNRDLVPMHPLEKLTMWVALTLFCSLVWYHGLIPFVVKPIIAAIAEAL